MKLSAACRIASLSGLSGMLPVHRILGGFGSSLVASHEGEESIMAVLLFHSHVLNASNFSLTV